MADQEGDTAGNGAYVFHNGGWTSITGPAGSYPQYQANANATPPGGVIPGSPLKGRGLPGGTPEEKFRDLSLAVATGAGVGRLLGGSGAAAAPKAMPSVPPTTPTPTAPPPSWGPGANRFITNVQNNIKALQQQQQQPPSPTGPTPPPQTAVQSPMGAPGPAAKPSDWAFIRKLLMGETVKDTVGHVIKSLLNAP
jgi:hypothetical protein